jgi:hypothetical protein
MAKAKRSTAFGVAFAFSSVRMVRTRQASLSPRSKLNPAGSGGVKLSGLGGECVQAGPWVVEGEEGSLGLRRLGPFRTCRASRRMECKRRSWEEMKEALSRSPVQRVMSMQSRL